MQVLGFRRVRECGMQSALSKTRESIGVGVVFGGVVAEAMIVTFPNDVLGYMGPVCLG